MNIGAKMKELLNVSLMFILLAYAIDLEWTAEIPISPVDDTASSLPTSSQRCIVVDDDGRIHVVWDAQNSTYPDVYWGVWYARNYGPHWILSFISAPIYSPTGYLYNFTNVSPTIAISDEDQVHVWWDGFSNNFLYEFGMYGTSSDNGSTWQYPIDPEVWEYWAPEPPSGFNSLCGDRENYLMFMNQQWIEEIGGVPVEEYRLLGGFSTNGGTTWERTPWCGSVTPQKSDIAPCTACDRSDTGYVVWQSWDVNNQAIILFAKFDTDVGAPPDTEFILVPHPDFGARQTPFIESDLAGKLYIVWSDSRDGNYEIYFKKSTDGGATWSSDQRLTNATGSSNEPALVLGNPGEIYLVWIDTRDGNSEVYFKYSEDDGTTWSEDTRLTDNPSACSRSHIAISPNKLNLYVVWNDTRDGQEEVYLKRGNIVQSDISESFCTKKETDFEIIPNPFQTECVIKYVLGTKQYAPKEVVSVKICDASGRVVRDLSRLTVNGQRSTVVWNGTDDAGRKLPAGVYFVQLEAGDYKATEKVILLR